MTKILDLILGFITCLFGYKFSKALLAILGFIIGYKFALASLPSYIIESQMVTTCSIIIGIIIGFISYKLYLIGIFILCGVSAYILCQFIGINQSLRIIFGIISGILAGILGVKFTKPLLIISTSLSGTTLLIKTLFSTLNFNNDFILMVIYIIIVTYSINYQLKQQ